MVAPININNCDPYTESVFPLKLGTFSIVKNTFLSCNLLLCSINIYRLYESVFEGASQLGVTQITTQSAEHKLMR